jgi:hypothetical protein
LLEEQLLVIQLLLTAGGLEQDDRDQANRPGESQALTHDQAPKQPRPLNGAAWQHVAGPHG